MKHRFAVIALVAALAGCASQSQVSPPRAIILDGNIEEWPADAALAADAHYLYARFSFPDSTFSLQHSTRPVSLLIDADSSPATGFVSNDEALRSLGVDLEVVFSPRGKHGVAAFILDPRGQRTELKPADLDIAFAPTYSATWYEVRIARSAIPGLPAAGLASSGAAAAVVAVFKEDGAVEMASDPMRADLPPAAPHERAAALIPPKPADAIRIMEYNIEKSGPVIKPEAFRHIIRALDPDIVLMEEWEQGDAASVQSWFTALVRSETQWHVQKAPGDLTNGGGVLVASPFPLQPAPGGIRAADAEGKGGTLPVRYTAALVKTPRGDVLAGAVHLKCCGFKDSPEDRRRMNEARAINSAFGTAAAQGKCVRVLGGDLNLVGSRPPLDILRAGLDADGQDLLIAQPMDLGDAAYTTWQDWSTGFTPGRLDYVLYSGSNATVVNAFVLDTRRLNDESLARMGLMHDESAASDHMPVVIDLRIR